MQTTCCTHLIIHIYPQDVAETLGRIAQPRIWVLKWNLIKIPMCLNTLLFEHCRNTPWFRNRVRKWFLTALCFGSFLAYVNASRSSFNKGRKRNLETAKPGNIRQPIFHYFCALVANGLLHGSCWFTLLGHLFRLVSSRRPAAEHFWKSTPKKLMNFS